MDNKIRKRLFNYQIGSQLVEDNIAKLDECFEKSNRICERIDQCFRSFTTNTCTQTSIVKQQKCIQNESLQCSLENSLSEGHVQKVTKQDQCVQTSLPRFHLLKDFPQQHSNQVPCTTNINKEIISYDQCIQTTLHKEKMKPLQDNCQQHSASLCKANCKAPAKSLSPEQDQCISNESQIKENDQQCSIPKFDLYDESYQLTSTHEEAIKADGSDDSSIIFNIIKRNPSLVILGSSDQNKNSTDNNVLEKVHNSSPEVIILDENPIQKSTEVQRMKKSNNLSRKDTCSPHRKSLQNTFKLKKCSLLLKRAHIGNGRLVQPKMKKQETKPQAVGNKISTSESPFSSVQTRTNRKQVNGKNNEYLNFQQNTKENSLMLASTPANKDQASIRAKLINSIEPNILCHKLEDEATLSQGPHCSRSHEVNLTLCKDQSDCGSYLAPKEASIAQCNAPENIIKIPVKTVRKRRKRKPVTMPKKKQTKQKKAVTLKTECKFTSKEQKCDPLNHAKKQNQLCNKRVTASQTTEPLKIIVNPVLDGRNAYDENGAKNTINDDHSFGGFGDSKLFPLRVEERKKQIENIGNNKKSSAEKNTITTINNVNKLNSVTEKQKNTKRCNTVKIKDIGDEKLGPKTNENDILANEFLLDKVPLEDKQKSTQVIKSIAKKTTTELNLRDKTSIIDDMSIQICEKDGNVIAQFPLMNCRVNLDRIFSHSITPNTNENSTVRYEQCEDRTADQNVAKVHNPLTGVRLEVLKEKLDKEITSMETELLKKIELQFVDGNQEQPIDSFLGKRNVKQTGLQTTSNLQSKTVPKSKLIHHGVDTKLVAADTNKKDLESIPQFANNNLSAMKIKLDKEIRSMKKKSMKKFEFHSLDCNKQESTDDSPVKRIANKKSLQKTYRLQNSNSQPQSKSIPDSNAEKLFVKHTDPESPMRIELNEQNVSMKKELIGKYKSQMDDGNAEQAIDNCPVQENINNTSIQKLSYVQIQTSLPEPKSIPNVVDENLVAKNPEQDIDLFPQFNNNDLISIKRKLDKEIAVMTPEENTEKPKRPLTKVRSSYSKVIKKKKKKNCQSEAKRLPTANNRPMSRRTTLTPNSEECLNKSLESQKINVNVGKSIVDLDKVAAAPHVTCNEATVVSTNENVTAKEKDNVNVIAKERNNSNTLASVANGDNTEDVVNHSNQPSRKSIKISAAPNLDIITESLDGTISPIHSLLQHCSTPSKDVHTSNDTPTNNQTVINVPLDLTLDKEDTVDKISVESKQTKNRSTKQAKVLQEAHSTTNVSNDTTTSKGKNNSSNVEQNNGKPVKRKTRALLPSNQVSTMQPPLAKKLRSSSSNSLSKRSLFNTKENSLLGTSNFNEKESYMFNNTTTATNISTSYVGMPANLSSFLQNFAPAPNASLRSISQQRKR